MAVNVNIGMKLTGLALAGAALVAGAGVAGYVNIVRLDAAMDEVQKHAELQRLVGEADAMHDPLRGDVYEALEAAAVGDAGARSEVQGEAAEDARVLTAALTKGADLLRDDLVRALLAFVNAGLVPWVPEQGSVGASGDLAPLSHLALALMGEGTLRGADGAAEPDAAGLTRAGLHPFRYGPKECIAFINGTQAQSAVLALLVHDCQVLWRTALGAVAMSLEALRGTPVPFDPRIHEVRPHPGQVAAAGLMRELLADSESSGSRTGKTTPACRMPTACAASPRSRARSSTRSASRIAPCRWSSTPPPTTPSSSATRCSPAGTSTASRWPRRSTSWRRQGMLPAELLQPGGGDVLHLFPGGPGRQFRRGSEE